MKNYELIAELMKFPAGYDVCCGTGVTKNDIGELERIFVEGKVLDVELDEPEEKICFTYGTLF